MKSGPLRHVVQIQDQTASKDSHGTPKNVWTTLKTRRASVEPIVGREYFQSRQINAEVTTKFRFRAGDVVDILKPRMRLVHAGRWFDVISVMEVQTIRTELVVMASLLVERPL